MDQETCDFCLLAKVSNCINCKRSFCADHQNRKSDLYCFNCFQDIAIEDKQIFKPVVRYSIKRDRVITKIKSCKQIKFCGESWRLHSKLICSLDEQELHDYLEVSRASISLLEQEILHRKIIKAKQEIQKKASAPDQASKIQAIKSPKIQIPIIKNTESKMSKEIKKLNISPEMLKAMIAKLGG